MSLFFKINESTIWLKCFNWYIINRKKLCCHCELRDELLEQNCFQFLFFSGIWKGTEFYQRHSTTVSDVSWLSWNKSKPNYYNYWRGNFWSKSEILGWSYFAPSLLKSLLPKIKILEPKKFSENINVFGRHAPNFDFGLPMKIRFLKNFKIIVEIIFNSSLDWKFYSEKR